MTFHRVVELQPILLRLVRSLAIGRMQNAKYYATMRYISFISKDMTVTVVYGEVVCQTM